MTLQITLKATLTATIIRMIALTLSGPTLEQTISLVMVIMGPTLLLLFTRGTVTIRPIRLIRVVRSIRWLELEGSMTRHRYRPRQHRYSGANTLPSRITLTTLTTLMTMRYSNALDRDNLYNITRITTLVTLRACMTR